MLPREDRAVRINRHGLDRDPPCLRCLKGLRLDVRLVCRFRHVFSLLFFFL